MGVAHKIIVVFYQEDIPIMAENTLSTEALASTEVADKQLRRSLSFWELFCLSMGGIIGSGWLLASISAAAFAGPAVFLSWIIGGILILFIALNYAEISGMLPRSGAIVRYPHLTHGSYTGYLMAWAYFLTGVMVPVIEAEAVITYLSSLTPAGVLTTTGGILTLTGGVPLAIALTIIFFLLNFFGIKVLGTLNLIVTAWKFVIPVLTFIFLFVLFHAGNFGAGQGFAPYGINSVFQAIPLTGIVFAYLGFRQALEYGGEGKNPQRDVPRATILCVFAGVALYTLLQIGFIGAVNFGSFHVNPGDWLGLKSTVLAKAPLATLLNQSGIALFGAFAALLLVDAAISPSGTGMVYTGTGTRVLYGTSVDGYVPRVFQKINRWGIPFWSLVVNVVLGWLVLLPFPSWYKLVGVISDATVLTYVMGGVGLLVLRRTASSLPRSYRLPGASVLAPIGFIAASLIVFWSGSGPGNALDMVAMGVFIGLPIYGWFYGIRKMGLNPVGSIIAGILVLAALLVTAYYGPIGTNQLNFLLYWVLMTVEVILYSVYLWVASNPEKRHDIWRAAWLVALIQGLYLLTYFTSFGPQGKKAPIPFPLDTLCAIIFALIIFYFGYRSGYQTEEIAEMVNHTSEAAVAD